MKSSRTWQSIILVVICFLALLSQMYFASQLYQGLTLDANERREISLSQEIQEIDLGATTDLKASSDNTRNTAFQVSGGIIEVTAERESALSKAIFEVNHFVTIPLRPDLTLSFSILARQIDLDTDAGRVFIVLSNGTNTILLNYVVGYKEPDWKQGTYSYVFYQVGKELNTWFDSRRNLWDDLIARDFTMESKWDITSMTFGVISYWANLSPDMKMDALLNANKTSFYYEKSTFTNVVPTLQVSWLAVYEMIAGMVAFSIFSIVLLRTGKRFKSEVSEVSERNSAE